MAHFLRQCWRQERKPETYWFPPTVSLAMTAIQGNAVGFPRWYVLANFYGAIVVMVLVLPVVSFRVGKYPDVISTGPSCNMLQAPASLCSLTWHAIGQPG